MPRPHPLTRRRAWGGHKTSVYHSCKWRKLRAEWKHSFSDIEEHSIKYTHTYTVLTVECKEWNDTDNPWQTEWSTCTTRSTQMKCSGQVLNPGRIFPPLDWQELCMGAERQGPLQASSPQIISHGYEDYGEIKSPSHHPQALSFLRKEPGNEASQKQA